MGHDHPTRVLRDEHDLILRVADVLEWLLDVPQADLDFERVEKCVAFVRLFADAGHHGKEEDLLFPALEDRGMSRESGPIAVMLHEHRVGRAYAATMADELPAARDGGVPATERLTRAGRDYIDLIRHHILKEDNVLFNMADQMVSGPECARLCAAYDGTCDHHFEGRTKEELEALAAEIGGWTPA
jgi:hemerythrin-like domain-containing protein